MPRSKSKQKNCSSARNCIHDKLVHRYKKAAAGLLTAIVLSVNYCSISVVARYKKITIVKLILLIKFVCFFSFFFKVHFFHLDIFHIAHSFHVTIDLDWFSGYFEK